MGRNLAPTLAALLLAAYGSGCGAMLQAGYGFTEEETRRGTRTREIRVEGVPAGAVVERQTRAGAVRLADPRHDAVAFEVEETVEIPRSLTPTWIGVGLDAAGAAGAIVAAARVDDLPRGPAMQAAVYFGLGMVADIVAGIIQAEDREPQVVEFAPVEGRAAVTYVARFDGQTRTATLDPAWEDRVRFDFVTADEVAMPGGPRLSRLPSPPPPPPAVAEVRAPPPEPEEAWYGWQLLPLDAAAIAGFLVGVTQDDRALAYGSLGLFVAGPPVVHFLNGQFAKGGGSFAARTIGPLAGGTAGFVLGLFAAPFVDCTGILCQLDALGYGAIIGAGLLAGVAPILDDFILAWKPEDPETDVGVTVVPSPGVTADGGMTFGLTGRF